MKCSKQKTQSDILQEFESVMDKVVKALEKAVGIKESFPDMKKGRISYTPQKPDPTEFNQLYASDPLARDLIDKMVENGGLKAEQLGLVMR